MQPIAICKIRAGRIGSLRRSRQLSMYYFTLKRPVNARYARQAGYDPDDSSPTVVDLANPQARGPEFDVRLPVPWRFEAGLKTLPSASAPGVPSEIHVPANTLMAAVLDDGYVLLDDRVGQVFRITDRRDGSVDGVASVIFTLDRDYTKAAVEDVPDYEPFLSDNEPGETSRFNWARQGQWAEQGCNSDPDGPGCDLIGKEDEPARANLLGFPAAGGSGARAERYSALQRIPAGGGGGSAAVDLGAAGGAELTMHGWGLCRIGVR
jgi:hypothetical protein